MISPPLSSFARPRCFFLLSPFCSSLRRLVLPPPRSATLPSIAHSEQRRPSASPHNITSLLLLHRHPSNLRVPSLGLARAAVRATSGNRAAWSRHVVLYNSRSRVLRVHRLSLNTIEGGGGQTSAVRTITPTHFYRSRRRQTTIHARVGRTSTLEKMDRAHFKNTSSTLSPVRADVSKNIKSEESNANGVRKRGKTKERERDSNAAAA